jgi:hypothetical protein
MKYQCSKTVFYLADSGIEVEFKTLETEGKPLRLLSKYIIKK